MPRLNLPELEDQPWLPPRLRGWLTDCLRFLFGTCLHRTDLASRLAWVLRHSGEDRVLDLCSGSSGPWEPLLEVLEREHGLEPRVTLTDKYPNHALIPTLEARSGGRIRYLAEPVDARALPPSLPGVRTLIAGFHHFRPEETRGILADAVRRGRALAIFEISARSLGTVLMTPLVGLAVFAMTPFLRPLSLHRLAFTYVVPVIPLLVFWDGLASCCRSYTVRELEALAMPLERPGYRFRAGRERVRGLPVHLNWLVGLPESTSPTPPSPSSPLPSRKSPILETRA